MKKTIVTSIILMIASLFLATGCGYQWAAVAADGEKATQGETSWQEEFNLADRTLVPTGRNRYFVLEPGFQIILEGRDEKVVITVLDETVKVDGVSTSVVEEREWKSGKLVEVSRNFFAIDPETQDVFYFGEDVDDYKNGKVISHSGAWRAGKGNAQPGMIMPGQPYVGQKHYQETAPGIAMDRATVISLKETLETPAGVFGDCLKTKETTPLNPLELGYKTYAPGIGLIQDEHLLLTQYGFTGE